MTRREYRILELTHGDGTQTFNVEFRSNQHAHWFNACTRDTLDLAKTAIDTMKRGEVISKQVVWND